jgi:ComF family protein
MISLLQRAVSTIVNPIVRSIAPRHCLVCRICIEETQTLYQTTPLEEYLCGRCLDSFPPAPSSGELYNDLLKNFSGDELSISKVYARYTATRFQQWTPDEDTKQNQISEYPLDWLYDDEVILDSSGEPPREPHILTAIHYLKYQGYPRLGLAFGNELGAMLNHIGCDTYTAIVPVPIHHARKRERGYNQAECIAEGINLVLKQNLNANLIRRVRYTSTQTKLSRIERIKNISTAFVIDNPKQCVNSTYLIVDDVITSGSTLNTIATTLLNAGAKQVDVVAIAKAQ